MKRILIIAEAGVNHNGDLKIARKLVDAAKEAGADIVKFQTFQVSAIVSKHAQMADYQIKNTGKSETQKEMLERLALSQEAFRELAEYCRQCGIMFLSTPFDIESIDFLDGLQEIWKIPSGEITNYPYLVRIGKTGKRVILSTGMCDMQEIHEAIDVLEKSGSGKITILHCTTEYPAPFDELNLNAIRTLRKEFCCEVGYSDHSCGMEAALAAAALGAGVIEKHFTLDRGMPGPDHKASIEPFELKQMVQGIRRVELALGDGSKVPSHSEYKNRKIARKSIVAKRVIRKGEVFSEENLTTKRPGTGLSPMRWEELMGKRAPKDFEEDEMIEI